MLNTDSPDVSIRTELVESIGAFTRLFGKWDENDTADLFIATLPSNIDSDSAAYGLRISRDPLQKMLSKGKSVREAWLSDAYRLRSQYAHGHVGDSPYKSAWTVHEHLLLAAYIFPLTVKATLAAAGHYRWTEEDQVRTDTFDSLATLERFSGATIEEELEGALSFEKDSNPWRETLSRFRMRRLVTDLTSALWSEAEESISEQGPEGAEETDQQKS